MMLNKLTLTNFKLLKKVELNFNKLNVIKGINFDVENNSSNGCAKSSILEAIIFALYSDGSGKNLQDLISFGTKESTVILDSDIFRIIRKIPTELAIFQHDKEIQFNTNTLKQNYINDQIGNYDFFKKYRLINKQAINLLDLGIVSLRKELMQFINLDFTQKRQSLLSKKLERENYSKDKKLYKFYLSNKRLSLLESGLIRIQDIYKEQCSLISEQNKVVNNIKAEIRAKEQEIYYKEQELKKLQQGICPIIKER